MKRKSQKDSPLRWCDALAARFTTANHLLDATLRRILERDEVHPNKIAA